MVAFRVSCFLGMSPQPPLLSLVPFFLAPCQDMLTIDGFGDHNLGWGGGAVGYLGALMLIQTDDGNTGRAHGLKARPRSCPFEGGVDFISSTAMAALTLKCWTFSFLTQSRCASKPGTKCCRIIDIVLWLALLFSPGIACQDTSVVRSEFGMKLHVTWVT